MISEYFTFNGQKSSDFNISNVRVNITETNTPYWGNREIIKNKIPFKDNPYLIRVRKTPIELSMEFSLTDNYYTQSKRKEIAEWLIHDTYKELIIGDDASKVFYAIVKNASDLYLFANGDYDYGYFPINFETNAWHCWSPVYQEKYDLRDNTSTTDIIIENLSNIDKTYYYPIIQFELYDDETGFSMINNSDSGREFSFSELNTEETIYVDNKRKYIETDVSDTYRYSKFNGNFFRLKKGINNITVTGKCILTIKMQFPILI